MRSGSCTAVYGSPSPNSLFKEESNQSLGDYGFQERVVLMSYCLPLSGAGTPPLRGCRRVKYRSEKRAFPCMKQRVSRSGATDG